MENGIKLMAANPTVYLKEDAGKIRWRWRLALVNEGEARSVEVRVCGKKGEESLPLSRVESGQSTHDIAIGEISESQEGEIVLRKGSSVLDRSTIHLTPPRHWVVHLIHSSHHDIGYTDLPSNIFQRQAVNLEAALDMAAETDDYPPEARFRIVVEQLWSALAFVRRFPQREAEFMKRVREGRFELTALFGNMTTECCGHESLTRALYPAFYFRKKTGIPITTAEHNDIPGMSWGLCEILADAGIKLFCPNIPRYHEWGDFAMPSFWNDEVMQPKGLPRAFWWESPSGKRLLLWLLKTVAVGGKARPDFSGLAELLAEYEKGGYPYATLRWKIFGAVTDNAPYLVDYAAAVREWNQRWLFPKLILSTNTMFYGDLVKELRPDLPVYRGELPGQDYPAGTGSTALPTAINRNNHSRLMNAEHLAAMAHLCGHPYPNEKINRAYEEVLLYDEHTWGYHFPCGPAAAACEAEKAARAYRASAEAQDVADKAAAFMADQIRFTDGRFEESVVSVESNRLKDDRIALVVYNLAAHERTAAVLVPMRSIDGCEIALHRVPPEQDPEGHGYLRGALLGNRWHEIPPLKFLSGAFDLIEADTGMRIAFQLIPRDQRDAVPYAAQRYGLGSGRGIWGTASTPEGLKVDLGFIADKVPAMGYKTYMLVEAANDPAKRDSAPKQDGQKTADGICWIENEYYRIEADRKAKRIVSIHDKQAERELLDPGADHGFLELVVQSPLTSREEPREISSVEVSSSGPICRSLELQGKALGHPVIRQSVILYQGVKKIYTATRILKDATPLLNVHLAFPFQAGKPRFRYEGCLSAMDPIADYYPGAFSDILAVQNWVKMQDDGYCVLWSSLDAPVARFSRIWKGNISPAHRCILNEQDVHPPMTEADLDTGWIYSTVFENNFVTNFSASQVVDVIFRYVISTREGTTSDAEASRFGWDAVLPLETLFTRGGLPGRLPLNGSFIHVDNPRIILLTFKQAMVGRDMVLRFWNVSDSDQGSLVRLLRVKVQRAFATSVVEEGGEPMELHGDGAFSLSMKAKSLATVRVEWESA